VKRNAFIIVPLTVLSLLAAGCESTQQTDQQSLSDRQNAALRDPFSMGPDPMKMTKDKPKDEVDPTDVTGGSIDHFDSKAFWRDMGAIMGN
jgi:hypothetical protein